MVSVDTPEKAEYAGLPPTAQAKLDRCRQRLQDGTYQQLPQTLRSYLLERLTPDAAERHINAGIRASQEFQALLDRRLTRPDGVRRKVATVPTGELIDRYGRLLAYLAPWFTGSASDPLPPRNDPQRRTFNLDMVEAGWGAQFLIYPSLPQNDDLNLLLSAAQAAWDGRRGAWAEFGETLLLAYEYRACIKLGVKQLDDPAAAIAEAYGTTLRGNQGGLKLPPEAAQAGDPPRTRPLHSPGRPRSKRSTRDQRARREVELASVRDCDDDPHRRSLTAAPTPRPASLL